MRAALLLDSQAPNGPALKAAGVDTIYKESRRTTVAELDELRTYFGKVGVMRVAHWDVGVEEFNAMTREQKVAWAKEFAKRLSQDITDLASPSFGYNPKQCYAIADIEYHSNLFLVEFIKAFRALRNKRILLITTESMQGGWMEPDLVTIVNGDPNIILVPQRYEGNMKVIDGGVAALDLTKRGFKPEKITSFLGLRDERWRDVRIPSWWDGILYVENKTQNDNIPNLI